MCVSDAAGFHPAVRGLTDSKARDGIVYHDRARIDLPGDTFAACAITSPHAGSKAVLGIIGQAHGLRVGTKSHNRKHWAEGLFAHYPHFVIHISQNRW